MIRYSFMLCGVAVLLSGCGIFSGIKNLGYSLGEKLPVSNSTSRCDGGLFCFGNDSPPPVQGSYSGYPTGPVAPGQVPPANPYSGSNAPGRYSPASNPGGSVAASPPQTGYQSGYAAPDPYTAPYSKTAPAPFAPAPTQPAYAGVPPQTPVGSGQAPLRGGPAEGLVPEGAMRQFDPNYQPVYNPEDFKNLPDDPDADLPHVESDLPASPSMEAIKQSVDW